MYNMKNKGFIICFCLAFGMLHAQSNFFYQNDNLQLWFEDDSTLYAQAQKTMQIAELAFIMKERMIKFDDIASSFHFLDYDNDGDRDLILLGKISETPYVIFFNKRDTDYALALMHKGVVIQANMPNQGNGIHLTVYFTSCCGYYLDIMASFACVTYRSTSYFNVLSRSLLFTRTLLPTQIFEHPLQFKTIKICELRITPEVDRESRLAGMHGWTGNALGMFSIGATGVILAEKRTKTNEFWYFVRMNNEPNIHIHSNRFTHLQEGIDDPQDCYTYGWIKAEDVAFFSR
jgi:hypothetical protein